MSRKLRMVGLLIALLPQASDGGPAPAAEESASGFRKLFVAPASTSLAGGKVKLTTTVLTRERGVYAGGYQLKVTPYFFKSEKGKLSITASDEALLRLTPNTAVEFTGKSTTDGTGKTRPVSVKAMPSAKDRGALTIRVETENGPLVFETSYRLGE